jgi:acyl carrier protein
MSDRAQMLADLKAMIVRECDKEEMDPSEIGDDLDLDSLDALQISMAVKENYGVRIEGGPDARKALASINALADFIEAERSKTA